MKHIVRKTWSHVIAVALLCCIAVFTTCKNNIGLGNTIDINPPEIKSVYPPIGAVIKGSFILAVKAEDDTTIKQVSALIKNESLKYAENFTANLKRSLAELIRRIKMRLAAVGAANLLCGCS